MDDNSTTIQVNNLSDRIVVRQQVREAARCANFGLMEQAKISLAVYDVISRIDMGTNNTGKVVVHQMQNDGRTGMQVICVVTNKQCLNLSSMFLSQAALMIDEVSVDESNPASISVTIAIWAT